MMLQTVLKILAGVIAGGAVGWLLGRLNACYGGVCNMKRRMLYAILAGTVFGGALAWHLIRR